LSDKLKEVVARYVSKLHKHEVMIMKYTVLIALFLLSNSKLFAASFDCKKATQNIEKTICQNSKLSEIDEKIADVYLKLALKLDPVKKKKLKKEQNAWLQSRAVKCAAIDARCLIKTYQERFFEINNIKKSDNLVPFKLSKGSLAQSIIGQCYFNKSSLPTNFKVYAGGAYKGKGSDHQIDDSCHEATIFDVLVNNPNENDA